MAIGDFTNLRTDSLKETARRLGEVKNQYGALPGVLYPDANGAAWAKHHMILDFSDTGPVNIIPCPG